MPTIDEIIKTSKTAIGCTHYETIEYDGVKLLTTRAKVKELINITWEFTRDPAVKKLAEKLGIKLRELRR